MTPDSLIDDSLELWDDVGADDLANVRRRVKILSYLNHVNSYVHNFAPWEWTYKEGTITFLNGATSAPLDDLESAPDVPDFLEFGRSGSLFDPARNLRMKETTRYKFSRLRNEGIGGGSQYPNFAVFGGEIHLLYAVSGDTPFTAFYRQKAIRYEDDTTEMLVPDRYRDTVIFPALIYRLQEGKSDARETWAAQFQQGLSQMLSIENPGKTEGMKLPLAIRGAW